MLPLAFVAKTVLAPSGPQVTPSNYQLNPVLSHDWDAGSSGYRARRITRLLCVRPPPPDNFPLAARPSRAESLGIRSYEAIENGRKLTSEDMKAIQLDTQSGARTALPFTAASGSTAGVLLVP